MKKVSIRNIIIILLCITIVFLSFGFCILSLKLDNILKKEEVFDVVISKVVEDTSIKGGKVEPKGLYSITKDNHQLDFNFKLNNPHDELSYKVTIKNKGTIKAKIIDLVKTPDYINDSKLKSSISPIKISVTDIADKELNPDEETEITIVVLCGEDSKMAPNDISLSLSLLAKSA